MFFNSFQKQDESVTAFGCRLETLLQTAIQNGHLAKEAKNDLMRHKFWTSLLSEKLKSQTRHKYDTLSSYDELLREIRMVDKEINITATSTKQPTSKVTHQPVMADSQADALEKRMLSRMDDLEKKLDTKIDEKFNLILQKLDERPGACGSDQHQSSHRGGSRGYDRGFYRNKPEQQQPIGQQQQQQRSR